MTTKLQYPTVLAFEKKIVPSDAYMYGTTWENKEDWIALKMAEKTVRATKSAKGEAKPEETNIQTVDHCSLSLEQDTLKLSFTLKILSNLEKPSACNSPEFHGYYTNLVANYKEKHGFKELAKRYATNIANARFLWRNRVGAENINVEVKALSNESEQVWSFIQEDMNIRQFDVENEKINSLANEIAKAFMGEIDYLRLEINTFALIGNAQDVYPSEEFVQGAEKSKEGGKSKILYVADGIAAMHSQKIGNALRTIDTWYPVYEDKNMPIAIEPFGSVTNLNDAYRRKSGKESKDFYTLFEQYVNNGSLNDENDEHYVMAVLIRGGVFGGKS